MVVQPRVGAIGDGSTHRRGGHAAAHGRDQHPLHSAASLRRDASRVAEDPARRVRMVRGAYTRPPNGGCCARRGPHRGQVSAQPGGAKRLLPAALPDVRGPPLFGCRGPPLRGRLVRRGVSAALPDCAPLARHRRMPGPSQPAAAASPAASAFQRLACTPPLWIHLPPRPLVPRSAVDTHAHAASRTECDRATLPSCHCSSLVGVSPVAPGRPHACCLTKPSLRPTKACRSRAIC
mmetsp:Transcript_52356/g.111972  ORF Transcript_52356/g.111972 Transcript_52356/m.111972 type:complete len:235 (+) Transcript_52356:200-904(+)